MTTVLVTGATGMIGPFLVRHLLSQGYSVRALCRNQPLPNLLPPQAQIIVGDICDQGLVHLAMPDVDVVYHLAARLHILSPSPQGDNNYWRVNVEGTRIVAEAAARSGVARLVYFSTVKVYGTRQRRPVEEAHRMNTQTEYARTKLEGERAALITPALTTTVLRLSPIYGPRIKGSWARLVNAIAQNRFVPIGNLTNVHSLTHVDDVARAALLAAEHPAAAGKIYNLVGYESPTLHDILRAIYAACGKTLPQVRIPSALAIGGAFLLEKGLDLLGKPSPFPVDSVRQFIQDEAYSGAALRALGFAPEVSLDAGWPSRITDA